ncbi:MAG TPA: tyrosine-type recombinase/integrase, partial [Actinospica sp.]|nr:tyrosine-type recombinase/integrase [Actinospica sp.]
AGTVWEEFDLLFCQPTGRPVDPRDDWEEFKEILKAAGVGDHRVHDARHTSGTELSELDVDMDDIMAILGHTDARTTKRYVHRSSRRAKEAMRLVGEAYWPTPKESPQRRTETGTETGSTRAARKRRRRQMR